MKKILCILLSCVLLLSLTACTRDDSDDLMVTVNPNEIKILTDLAPDSAAVTDFGIRLFRQSYESDQNTLISPLSVLYALSMTANGAEGDTLAQMEAVLGLDVQTLNVWLRSYRNMLELSENGKLSLANAIWFRDDGRFTVKDEFLQTNADYYGAGIFKAPFDQGTCRDINNWVKENTDGMIEEILNEISDGAVMYLVNALAFDSQWQEVYRESDINEGQFTTERGLRRTVDMMYSEESLHLSDNNAEGFIKFYEGGDYAFAALLPNEGITVEEYLDTLTGDHLNELLSSAEDSTVHATMPRFTLEYDAQLSDILKAMGMTDAFDGDKADLSGIGHSERGNLFINRVLHKTYICVDGKGTKAGAATAVEVNDECAMIVDKVQVVNLDRPFVYMLIDTKYNIPFFIGTMQDPTGEAVMPIEEVVLTDVPEMDVTCGDVQFQAKTGNYSWEAPGSDGQTRAVIACGSHPLDGFRKTEFTQVNGDLVKVSFPVQPDEITVIRWRESDVGNVDKRGERIEMNNMSFSIEEGCWVYSINAKWERDTWGGSAEYHLYLKR